tara:strand:+ start:1704 stop:1937 length:234 start_codon:yes stop_codon:yes gene_type:complete
MPLNFSNFKAVVFRIRKIKPNNIGGLLELNRNGERLQAIPTVQWIKILLASAERILCFNSNSLIPTRHRIANRKRIK